MLLRRLKYPRTAGLIFRRKMKQLRANHLENGYFKQYPFMRDWWQESKRTITLPNGSRIVLGYAENPGDIDDFQGDEYMDILVDEAARVTENELIKLNAVRRWTGQYGGKSIPDRLCKTFWLMNPGGPGHNYIRRLMYKKEYHGAENPENYCFIQAYAWDNIEWARAALEDRNISVEEYYQKWTNEERFQFFIKNTQYGQELNALPQRLRVGWLLGDWDEFAGQFYDIWDEEKFVKRCLPARDWHPRWLGIDWGFQHPCSTHWFAQEKEVTKVYREFVNNLHSARAQAQEIVDKTPEDERKLIDAIYLSPDAFQHRNEQDSYAEQMGAIFRQFGMPYPTMADDDRKHGSQACYELMRYEKLEIDPSCVKLREVIPMVCTEEDDPEEIEKFDGDDPFDSFRYGVKSRQRPGKMPVQEAAQVMVQKFAESRKKSVDDLDINTVACLSRRALALERRRRRGRRGGLGRIWKNQPTGGVTVQ